MKIHIFNIDSDYSLADFSPLYTPPKRVVSLRREMALTPLKWAAPSDKVLLLDAPAYEDALHHPAALTLDRLAEFLTVHTEAAIEPWGWTPALKHTLQRAGVADSYLPTDVQLEAIRRLSHRHSTIPFNSALNDALLRRGFDRKHLSEPPLEFFTVEEAMEWHASNHPAFFKAPWSSSGRGVLFTDSTTPQQTEEWLRGIIRRQGSVMAEHPYAKVMDCATEWLVTDDGVEFLGVSVFDASRRGKYHFNIEEPQEALVRRIREAAPDFGAEYIECQREALEYTILIDKNGSDAYRGPVGIDMVIGPDGDIHGGIELNFRRTMGMASLTMETEKEDVVIIGAGNVGSHLYAAFTQGGVNARLLSAREYDGETIDADVVILCVRDSEIVTTAERMNVKADAVVAHTSGSIGIDALEALRQTGIKVGVFYPLQTFSRDVAMSYSDIPFLIEGSDISATCRLEALAQKISPNVLEADSKVRGEYHLAAVVACNFANHLWSLADRYLEAKGLPFDMLHPLLRQTLDKAMSVGAHAAQTGPARRGDLPVIEAHLRRLGEDFSELAEIYRSLSESILREYGEDSSAKKL